MTRETVSSATTSTAHKTFVYSPKSSVRATTEEIDMIRVKAGSLLRAMSREISVPEKVLLLRVKEAPLCVHEANADQAVLSLTIEGIHDQRFVVTGSFKRNPLLPSTPRTFSVVSNQNSVVSK